MALTTETRLPIPANWCASHNSRSNRHIASLVRQIILLGAYEEIMLQRWPTASFSTRTLTFAKSSSEKATFGRGRLRPLERRGIYDMKLRGKIQGPLVEIPRRIRT